MQAAIRDDDRALRRIVAMLMALAVLSERAGSRSFPVRFLVLSILRSAEAVARVYVAEATQAVWPRFDERLESPSRPADAMDLALRFVELAVTLGALLQWADRFDGRDARIDCAPRRLSPRSHRPLMMPASWARTPHDTS